MPSLPRIARVPHTSKLPEACPHCGSHVLTRRGTRKKKLEIVQLWRCASCKRVFTPGPAALHNKTYPLRMILSALTDYNTGLLAAGDGRASEEENQPQRLAFDDHDVARRVQAALHLSPLARRWPRTLPCRADHPLDQAVSPAGVRLRVSPTETRSSSAPETLDDKRTGDTRFAPLADFLESIPTTCPHDLFRRDDDPKARASQATPAFADVSRIIVNRKENAATQTAALIIPAVGNNKLRHETLQRFMLANDSVTVAIEIPIWLTETDIAALEKQHGIELAPQVAAAERTITGHIDFLQVRNGAVHILDYKPDARTNKPIAQLAIYALALTRLVPGLNCCAGHWLARAVRVSGRPLRAGGAPGSHLRARAHHPWLGGAISTGRRRALAIYRDPRFWRVAPLSSVGIGTSWSLQGLWAAPWLRDVDGLDHASMVRHLTVMAVAVCVSALLLGVVADRLRRRGVKTELVLVSTLGVAMTAQAGLLLQWPLPSYVLWGTIAAAGAATVLSFAILTECFPKEFRARQRGPQPAARRWRIRPAVRNRPPYRAMARGPRDLSSRSAPGGDGCHARLATDRARLVCHAAAPAGTNDGPCGEPIPSIGQCSAGDSDDPLHTCGVGVDTTCGARPQTRAGLATCRKRIGDALHRSGGGVFHDDQSSGSGHPHLRDRPLGSQSS